MTSEDWLPTLMAAVGEPNIKEQLLKGTSVGGRDYKVHIDGYDQLAMLTGQGKSQRREFFFYGETELNAVRVDQWKLHLAIKNSWLGVAEKLEGGLLLDIKLDPFERTPDTGGQLLWMKEKSYVLLNRLRTATPLQRRMLAPVLLASVARALTVAVFLAGGGSSTLITALSFWAVPLAIALGLLRGRLYTAKVLQRLVSGLRSRPDARQLRDVMARALDDPGLQLVYWMPQAGHWAGIGGDAVSLDRPPAGRAVKVVSDPQNRPVAAIVHDEVLLEEPVLLDSVAGSMQSALESQRVETELLGAQARAASAMEQERRRIERDLHDGAQQRLLALRMKIGVTQRLLDQDPRRAAALLDEMGRDAQATLVEMRALAHGIVPPLLAERGLAAALADAAARAGLPTATQIEEVGRADPGVERAVYFCCLEALQNAAKHAGARARATLSLRRDGDELVFGVADAGSGASVPAAGERGQGLSNMRERMAGVGGSLRLVREPGGGMQVLGRAPATP